MDDTIEVSREAFEPISELVKLGLFKDEKEAVGIEHKLSELQARKAEMEKIIER